MSDRYTHSDNELYHYGVIGMRWGIRKAAKNGTNYSYRSHGQKKYQRKVNKLNSAKKTSKTEAKLDKSKEKLDLYKIRDKNRLDFAKKSSAGESFARTLVMGPVANGIYARYKASGNTEGEAFVKSVAWWMTVPVGPAQVLSRKREFDTARKELENRNKRRPKYGE